MLRPDKRGLQFFSLVFDVPFPSDAPGVKESSLRAGKWISSCSRDLRFPSCGCLAGATARLDRRAGFEKKCLLLF